MEVSVETIKGLEKKLTVSLPADDINQKIGKRLDELKTKVKLKGFRPGKAPKKIIEQYYGDNVRMEVLQEAMKESFGQAIQQEKLKLAGQPKIEPKPLEDNQSFEYTAIFEVFPEISLKPLDEVEVEQITSSIAEQDIKNQIEALRKSHAKWEDKDGLVDKSDKVTIDFIGKLDGKEFPGGSATDFNVDVGSDHMIPGFEDGLIGLKVGEEKTLSLTFPKDYSEEELAAKDCEFTVKIREIKTAKLPDVDDEFAKKINIKDGSAENIAEYVRENLEEKIEKSLKLINKNAILKKFREVNPIDLPVSLIKEQIELLKKNFLKQLGKDIKIDDMPDDVFSKRANTQVHNGLLLNEFIKVHEVKVDDDKVREEIEQRVKNFGDQKDYFISMFYENENLLNDVKTVVLEAIAIEKLAQKAILKNINKSYQEVMNIDANQ